MPFAKFDVIAEIEKQCTMSPEFKRIHEESQRNGVKYDADEIGELMREFPDSPFFKNFVLEKEATEKLFEAMKDPSCVAKYEKNNRLLEGKELLEKLSKEFGRCEK